MYDHILVPTDGSEGALAAAEHAVDLAREHGATIHALYVLDQRQFPQAGGSPTGIVNPSTAFPEIEEKLEREGEEAVEAVADVAAEAGVDCETAVVSGIPNQAIVDYAADNDVDLVVIATHGRTGVSRLLIGSVTERVVRQSPVPVLTVRSEPAAE